MNQLFFLPLQIQGISPGGDPDLGKISLDQVDLYVIDPIKFEGIDSVKCDLLFQMMLFSGPKLNKIIIITVRNPLQNGIFAI